MASPHSDICTANHSSQESVDQVELDNMNDDYIKDDDNSSIECLTLRLRKMKINYINYPAYINVNSIQNKHADLFTIINLNVDILTIAETKPDSSAQFTVDGYSGLCHKDRMLMGQGYWCM